jgi:hypothetical protein
MPRRSVTDIATRRPGPTPEPPPADPKLSAPERELWDAVVGSKPAGWFDAATAPVLREYVRAAVMCDVLAARLSAVLADPDADQRALRAAHEMRDREAKRAVMLATRLRLTPQSRYTPHGAASAANKPGAGSPRPWADA